MKYWVGEVRNVKDPMQSGRVQLRIYGQHDDETNIKDEHLPWGMPLQPITSAATAKIGTAPVGMIPGSRVMGFYLDAAEQYPIILGTFARAGAPKDKENNTGGEDDTDKAKNDIPSYARDVKPGTQQSNTLTANTHKDITKTDKYNEAEFKADDDSKDLTELAKKKYAAYNGDLPSLASIGKKDVKPVLDMIQQIDPKSESAVLPEAVKNFQKILHISDSMSAGGGANMAGSALGNVLQSLGSNGFGFNQIMSMLGNALGTQGSGSGQGQAQQTAANSLNQLGGYTTPNNIIAGIEEDDCIALYNALIQLLNNTQLNTLLITPPKTYPRPGYTFVPAAGKVVAIIPDGWIQVFSFTDLDPYPGYILWESPEADNYMFTPRPPTMPYTSNPTECAINAAIAAIEAALYQMAKEGKFDINKLLALLGKAKEAANNQAAQNSLGQNAQNNQNILQQILGQLGGFIQQAMTDHVSKSVLKSDKVEKALKDYTKKVAITKKKKDYAKKAVSKKKQDSTSVADFSQLDYTEQGIKPLPSGFETAPQQSAVTNGTDSISGTSMEVTPTADQVITPNSTSNIPVIQIAPDGTTLGTIIPGPAPKP